MPNPPNVGGVVGTDNVSPIYNPNARWQMWNMNEIYLGQEATNKYVPKVGDVVVDITGARITNYIVEDINPTTMVPVLREEDKISDDGLFSDDDVLTGIIPDVSTNKYRLYIDKSVTPYRINVDAYLRVGGTMVRWCKLFKGVNISSEGTVISRVYDSNGNLISENIPLELVATELLDNRAIKCVSTAYTNADLVDGELVTAVFYDDAGFAVSKRQLLVENTGFIRSTDADKKYIISIHLESPFISNVNTRLIQYPINVPLSGLNLTGVVTYSNGEVKKYPVDGTKFSIFGFDQYVATLVGQSINLVLKYAMAPDEVAYNLVVGGDNHIAELYEAKTLAVDGSYNLKLFGYPVWIDAVNGYRLQWSLYNLDRNIAYDATPYVYVNASSAAFNPLLYGQLQRLSVSLNIRNVNSAYKNYVHTQTIDFVLNRPGTERETNWTIGFTPDQNPRYGVDVFAKAKFQSADNWKFDIRCNETNLTNWLNKVYRNTQPLNNPQTEAQAPDPTHFNLVVGNTRIEFPIAQWNQDLVFVGNVANSSNIYIEFIKKTNVNDLYLAVAGMITYHADSTGNLLPA